MNAQIILKDDNSKEIINVDNITSKNSLMYKDNDNAFNVINIFEKAIRIKRIDKDHETLVFLSLNEDSYIEIKTAEGSLRLETKVLEFLKNNDIISIAYKINNEIRSIDIRFLGAQNDN